MSEESIFAAALALGSPAERAAYLDRACAADPGLRRQVEELLAAHAADNPLNHPPADLDGTGSYTPTGERPGATVGPYKLLQQIGEGGMGTVYMAEQTVPVRRKVALKIIKPGLNSKQVVARFEAERQALSLMDHPNIAKVLDAGATASGRPYFVMELVHGVPITQFCDANKLTPRERLALFVPVCQAIQHAHQKGVIHRDIKPSNVLVTLYDDKPVPKVIDFGVAKAVEQRLTERTLFTQFGALVGTFEYMSPEQAEMNALGVDTRSDVYSLGVLLYELLTGTTPLEKGRLRGAALGEVVRLIKEEEPPRPSRRLSTSNTLAKLAAARRTEPAKLSALVRGELDWIAMRCLEKDRTRRYDSAGALARDVERYLKGEAVEACPPTVGYRMRKFGHKHRTAIGMALVVAFALVAVTVVSVWQAGRALEAEAEAARDRDDAIASRQQADAARQAVATERDNVTRANQALRRLTEEQRQTLYATSLNLAQAAWETGNPARTFDLLRQQIPRPGEDDLRGFEWHYWDRFAHQDLKTVRLAGYEEASGGGRGARLSPDGTRVAAFATDPAGTMSLKFWDTATGRVVWSVPVAADHGGIAYLDFSRDSGRLVSVRNFGPPEERARASRCELSVWDTATGKTVYAEDIRDVAFLVFPALAPDGSRVAFVFMERGPSKATRLSVRQIPDGKELFRYPPEKSDVTPISPTFSPDGKRLAALVHEAALGRARSVRLWDLESGQEMRRIVLPGSLNRGVSFSPDGSRLATPNIDGPTDQIILWDSAGGAKQHVLRLPTSSGAFTTYYPAAFAPDGRRLAVRQGAQVYCLDTAAGGSAAAAPPQTFRGHESWVQDVAFGAGGSRLVTLDEQGVVKWWDPAPRQRPLRTPLGWRFGSRAVVANPDGSRIALGPAPAESDRRLRLTDGNGRLLGDTPLPPGHSDGQAFSRDGRTFAMLWHEDPRLDRAYTLYVWDAVSGKEIRRLTPPAGLTLADYALSPDGARVAAFFAPPFGSDSPYILSLTISETATGQVVLSRRLPQAQYAFYPAYSPDGRWLAFNDHPRPGTEGRIVWLDAQTGEEVAALKFGKAGLTRREHLVFSPDGRFLATYPEDGPTPVRVWEVGPILRGENPAPRVTLTGHGGELTHVGFSPDGRRILTAGGGAVKLWDAGSGRELLTLQVGGATIRAAYFSPDGRTIWGGLDEDGRLWGWDGSPVREEKTP